MSDESRVTTATSVSSHCSSKSSSKSNLSTYTVVQSAVRDVFRIQQDALRQMCGTVEKERHSHVLKKDFEALKNELDTEKLAHSVSKLELQKALERCDFLTEENDILLKQLEKERQAHEITADTLKSKSAREQGRITFLRQQCQEAKEIMESQTCEMGKKDQELEELRRKLQLMSGKYQHAMGEIDLNKMQRDYFAKSSLK